MWLGRKQLGQECLFSVSAAGNKQGLVSWPSSPPFMDIWKGTSKVASGLKMPKVDSNSVGLFRLAVFLDGRFTFGQHHAIIRWVNGTYFGVQIDYFDILDNGNVNGSIISLFHHELPHARYLVYQTDAGLLLRGKNPSG